MITRLSNSFLNMQQRWPLYLLLSLFMLFQACQKQAQECSILLISSKGTNTIENLDVLKEVAIEKKCRLISTSNLEYIQEGKLDSIHILIISNLNLEELNHFQINALERYLDGDGRCIGISLYASAVSRYMSPKLYHLFNGDASTNRLNKNDPGNIKLHKNFIVLESEPDSALLIHALAKMLPLSKFKTKGGNDDQSILPQLPPDYWFEIDTLALDLNEPIELEVLPSGDVIYIERQGAIKLYDAQSKKITLLGRLPTIASESNGLNGMALGPDYANTGFIYLSYLSLKDSTHQRISRFRIMNGELDLDSEKIVMNIPIHKSDGWHGTNALEFDRHGNLYIALGDFTLQSNEIAGYAQIDERPGRARHDAQRTSASSNRYEGKILRIHPEPDGSYTIPEGNLFPEPTDQTKPEIYVMGCRNPYRFVIDSHSDVLYFGDVGPDAWDDGVKGPRGFDEVNIAKKAGFYGWPYFVADNKAYKDFDYSTGTVGPAFDPSQPINHSPNNTGLNKLPAPQIPALWYHKGVSEEFPYVGSGGMNIMVGPKYYADDYQSSPDKFPSYFSDRLFIYDWVRNWILCIQTDELNTTVTHIEPFLSTQIFNKIMDMKFSPDGSLYFLEYGSKGFQSNDDAALRRIRYSPGRAKPSHPVKPQNLATAWDDMLPIHENYEAGRELILTQSCLSCHGPFEKIIGPSFIEIAQRFANDEFANSYLPKKIREGGTGNWPGNIIMPAHHQLTEQQAQEITAYILSFRSLHY